MATSPPGVDVEAFQQWLCSQGFLEDAAAIAEIDLLEGGRSNLSFRVRIDHERDLVLRRPPLGHVLPTAHDMSREFKALQGLNSVGFPTPRALALCTDESVIGCDFLLMEFVDGFQLRSGEEAKRLVPVRQTRMSASFVGGLSDLHAVDVRAAGLDDFGRPDGYLTRQVSRWAQQWELTRTQENASMDAVRIWLQDRVGDYADTRASTVVHGDYRMDNTIFASNSDSLRAVLDWEMSTLGDPILDLATCLVYWTQVDDDLRAQVPVAWHLTSDRGFWSRSEIVEEYSRQFPIDEDRLDFCVVLACYKLAVIMESIRYRVARGEQMGTGAHEGEAMGRAVSALASMGQASAARGAVAGLGS